MNKLKALLILIITILSIWAIYFEYRMSGELIAPHILSLCIALVGVTVLYLKKKD